jgi:hypothetical protein
LARSLNRTCFRVVASSSDIDLFLYGLDSEDSAINRIPQLEAVVRENQRLSSGAGMALRSENAITFISPKYPYRHVQVGVYISSISCGLLPMLIISGEKKIILRLYKSISEILTGFDVDCACVAFDGKQVYSNPRGITAIATRTNTVDLSRRSPCTCPHSERFSSLPFSKKTKTAYENRLYKYRSHNFEVYWDSLKRSRINAENCSPKSNPQILTGLSRLIFFENILKGRRDPYRRKRLLKTIDDSGEPTLATPSGYATLEIPYGERFTATKYVQPIP